MSDDDYGTDFYLRGIVRSDLPADRDERHRVLRAVARLPHNDCCTHPRWRHRFASLSPRWRIAVVGWLLSKGIFLAYLLHPVGHTIARWLGIPCP